METESYYLKLWELTGDMAIERISAAAHHVASLWDTAWVNAGNAAALDVALDGNAGEIADLQAAVAANATLETWLEASNATAADVIAIGLAADGSLAVFID